jgi:hypothetical protein
MMWQTRAYRPVNPCRISPETPHSTPLAHAHQQTYVATIREGPLTKVGSIHTPRCLRTVVEDVPRIALARIGASSTIGIIVAYAIHHIDGVIAA